jgi:hypothetical protein
LENILERRMTMELSMTIRAYLRPCHWRIFHGACHHNVCPRSGDPRRTHGRART